MGRILGQRGTKSVRLQGSEISLEKGQPDKSVNSMLDESAVRYILYVGPCKETLCIIHYGTMFVCR